MGTKQKVKKEQEPGPAIRSEARFIPEWPVGQLVPSPYQVRRDMDVEELAANIRQFGIMHPLTAREIPGKEAYELIAGHRRLAAAKVAGRETVPVIQVTCDDRAAAEMCVAENMQRVNLSPLEEAECVKALLDTGHTAQDVADRLGKSRMWVSRRSNLLNLCSEIRKAIADPQSNVSLMPVEGMELLAALPKEMQKKLGDQFKYSTPTVAEIKRRIDGYMRNLDKTPFDMAECETCNCRTGCQPELFEVKGAGKLGRCMNAACWEKKKKETIIARVDAIKKKAQGAVIFSGDYNLRETVKGVRPDWDINKCKKTDKGAVEAYELDEDGNSKTVWIRKGKGDSDGGEAPKPKQPTPEQKRMAKVCRRVAEMINATTGSNRKQPNPLRDLTAETILSIIAVTGTRFNHDTPHAIGYAETNDKTPDAIKDEVWDMVAPVILRRISYNTIIECAKHYDEAVAVGMRIFGIDKKTLDGMVETAGK